MQVKATKFNAFFRFLHSTTALSQIHRQLLKLILSNAWQSHNIYTSTAQSINTKYT